MNATASVSEDLTTAAAARSTARSLSAALPRGATPRGATMKRRRRREPGVPVILNAPQQFGNSFRYPDGTWFHGE